MFFQTDDIVGEKLINVGMVLFKKDAKGKKKGRKEINAHAESVKFRWYV